MRSRSWRKFLALWVALQLAVPAQAFALKVEETQEGRSRQELAKEILPAVPPVPAHAGLESGPQRDSSLIISLWDWWRTRRVWSRWGDRFERKLWEKEIDPSVKAGLVARAQLLVRRLVEQKTPRVELEIFLLGGLSTAAEVLTHKQLAMRLERLGKWLASERPLEPRAMRPLLGGLLTYDSTLTAEQLTVGIELIRRLSWIAGVDWIHMAPSEIHPLLDQALELNGRYWIEFIPAVVKLNRKYGTVSIVSERKEEQPQQILLHPDPPPDQAGLEEGIRRVWIFGLRKDRVHRVVRLVNDWRSSVETSWAAGDSAIESTLERLKKYATRKDIAILVDFGAWPAREQYGVIEALREVSIPIHYDLAAGRDLETEERAIRESLTRMDRWFRSASGGSNQAGLEEGQGEPTVLADLEDRLPKWLKGVLGPDWMKTVYGVHEMTQVTGAVAVLLQPELLGVAGDDGDTEVNLVGMEGNLHAAFGWPEQTKLRLGLLTPTPDSVEEWRRQGFHVIRVLRHRESSKEPLPWEAIPLVVAEALADGRETFWVNVAPYLHFLRGITLPEILSTLTNLFA